MRRSLRLLAILCALVFLSKAIVPAALAAERAGAQPEHPCMMDGAAPDHSGATHGPGCCDGAGCDCGCTATHFPLSSPRFAPQAAAPATCDFPACAGLQPRDAPSPPFRPPA